MQLVNNRYQLIRPLGQGGMGIVFLAVDRLSGDKIALKRITIPDSALTFASMAQDEDVRLSLAREFQVLASLRHPNIISVLDYGFDEDGQTYFTMDYLPDGQPLVEYGRSQSHETRLILLLELLEALAYLYRRDIIHRDLKPDNVLVINGRVKVLDFGLAISREYAAASMDDTTGTVAYMAPEILLGQPASTASDLYAVGVMAYELFAGKHPFDTRHTNILLSEILNRTPDFAPLNAPNIENGPQLTRLIANLLAKEPDSRLSDIRQVRHQLNQLTASPTPPEASSIRESYLQAAKFVGRAAEMQALTAALDNAFQGKGSAWLLAGESGVGKSRLMDEVRIQAVVSGAQVLYGQTVEDGGRPFELWRNLLRHLVLMVQPDDLTAGILKPIVPDIEQLLERPVPDPPELEGSGVEQRQISAIGSLFRKLDKPVVLMLEDLQWAGRSLEALRPLVGQVSELPLLIVGNYRDDETADLPQKLPEARVLTLPRLNDSEVAELSRAILGRAGQEKPILTLLQKETEGNTFFIVEVLRTLAEEAGRLDNIARMALPRQVAAGGIQQIIQRRLARVPLNARPLLELAAVSGRQVDLAVLSHLVGEKVIVDDWLVSVSNAAVLEIKDERWRFSHDKLREGVLVGLGDGERPYSRPSLHGRVAEAIEAVYPDDEDQALPLVEHWRQAGNVERQAVFAPQAIEQLITISRYEDAAEIGRDVLDVYKADDGRANILRQLGQISFHLGRNKQAINYLEEGLSLAQETGNEVIVARILLILGTMYGSQNNYSQQHDYFLEALDATRRSGDERLLARNLHELGMATAQIGNMAGAISYYEQSLALGREIDFKWAMAASLNGLGWLAKLQGNYSAAEEYLSESLENYQAIGDRRGIGICYNNLAGIFQFYGDYEKAEDYYQQGLTIRREIGVKFGEAATLLGLGDIASLRGELRKAADYYQKSLEIWKAIDARWGIAQMNICFGKIDLQNNDFKAARGKFEEALQMFREIHDDFSITIALNQLGFLDLAEGKTAVARKHFLESLRTTAELGNTIHLLEAVTGMAGCLFQIGNAQGSAELVGVVAAHSSLSAEVRTTRLEPLRAALAARLEPVELRAALEKGEAKGLETAVQDILSE